MADLSSYANVGNAAGGAAGLDPAPAPAPAAAPPAPVAATLPAGPDYDSMFRSALDSSRSNIAQQFHLALGDIAQREGSANQALGMLPGQLTDIYGHSATSLANASTALDRAQQASGVRSFMSAADQLTPLRAASSNDFASRQADVPLLKLAVGNEFSRQRSSLQNAQLGAQDAVNQQLASYYGQRAGQQADAQTQMAVQNAQAANARNDVTGERAFQLQRDQQNFDQSQLALQQEHQYATDPATGMTYAEADAVRNSKAYKDALASQVDTHNTSGALWWRKTTGHKPTNIKDLYNKVRTDPKLLKVLIADIPELAVAVGTGKAGKKG